MSEEGSVESWRRLCESARQYHVRYLHTVRPIEHRSILQPDGLMYCVMRQDLWEPWPYTLESRGQVTEEVHRRSQQHQAWATAIIVMGVAPEQQAGQILLRPALLTTLIGLGIWASWRFEIVQRIEYERNLVMAYGAVSRVSFYEDGGEWQPDRLGMQAWPRVSWSQEESGSV